ncbi:MAG TPA: winged helix-turn-helix domain-containing protein, partial [Actinomycetes bacterium]|nr:winged helix-turn-helix domain-containing protein [Actinomycetes bacterium]
MLLSVRRGAGPLRRQVERELRGAIRSGRLQAGTALPSTRVLASQLGVSRGVVVEAYDQLVAEGYLLARQGSATRVAETAAAATAARGAEQAPQRLRYDFRPG